MPEERAATYSDLSRVVALRGPLVVALCSLGAVLVVFGVSLLSIGLVTSIKSVFHFVASLVLFLGELCAAVVAAVTSGVTVTLTVILAVAAASFTFPASSLQARVGVSIAVSAAGMASAALALLAFASLNVNLEIASAVISAAAVSVAFASAWAVGVMSLIEKETSQVGLRMTSLLDAVRRNNHRILKLLVKIQPMTKRRDLDLCLLHAVKAGFPECIEVLLSAGASVNTRDGYDNTPLILACETGSVRIVTRLLDAGAVVDDRNGRRGTALHHAAKWGYAECVELLIHRGADPNIQDSLWWTPLMLAARHAHQVDQVMRLLINAGCDVNVRGSEQRTALHHAAGRGITIDLLLRVGADPHSQDTEGNSPLHCAAFEGHANVIVPLLNAGCNPNVTNYQKRSPLHLAAIRGQQEALSALITGGGDYDMPDSSGHLPVWYSTLHKHIRATVYLLQRNCSLGGRPVPETLAPVSNPLEAALQKRHLALARILVTAGCNRKPLGDWLAEARPAAWADDSSAEHLAWLAAAAENPDSLSGICRRSIRAQLGRDVQGRAARLPLPGKLKEMVMLRELMDMCEDLEAAES